MKHDVIAAATPYVREIIYWEPAGLAQRLRGEANLTLLESVQRLEHLGRYSFLACNPSATLTAQSGQAFLNGVAQREAPLKLLDRLLAERAQAHVPGLPPFQGGFAGFMSYEMGRSLEPRTRLPDFEPLCPGMMLHRYDTVIAFDHMLERAWIIAPDARPADHLESLLKRKPASTGSHAIAGWVSNFTREEYEKAVARTIDYILAGDIFQANITQCFSAAMPPGFDAFANTTAGNLTRVLSMGCRARTVRILYWFNVHAALASSGGKTFVRTPRALHAGRSSADRDHGRNEGGAT